jgi:hypothetical protein
MSASTLVSRREQGELTKTFLTKYATLSRTLTCNKANEATKGIELWKCLCEQFPCKTFDEAFDMIDETESFRDIINRKREETTPANALNWQISLIGIIANGIMNYLDFVNRKNTMSVNQIKETAMLIFEEFPFITAPDVVLFNRLCKNEHFGELKDLNGSVLIRWYKKYFKERFDRLNDFRYRQEQEELKTQYVLSEPTISKEEIEERFERIAKSLRANRKTEQEKQSVHTRPASERIKKIRLRVISQHTDLLSYPDYDEQITALIEQEIDKEGLIEEYNKLNPK